MEDADVGGLMFHCRCSVLRILHNICYVSIVLACKTDLVATRDETCRGDGKEFREKEDKEKVRNG